MFPLCKRCTTTDVVTQGLYSMSKIAAVTAQMVLTAAVTAAMVDLTAVMVAMLVFIRTKCHTTSEVCPSNPKLHSLPVRVRSNQELLLAHLHHDRRANPI